MSPKLLFLGGTEVDVRELYHQMQEDLIQEKEQVVLQKAILEDIGRKAKVLENNIARKEKQIGALVSTLDEKQQLLLKTQGSLNEKQAMINQQAQTLEQQKTGIIEADQELQILRQRMKAQEGELQSTLIQVESSRGDMLELQTQIEEQKRQSEALTEVLEDKEMQIKEKEGTISNQIDRINDQNTILLLVMLLLTLAFALAISLIKAYRTKHQLTETLEQKVVERTQDLETSNEQLKLEMDERKRAEEREKAHQDAIYESSKLASLGTLVAGIGHEINNPNEVIMLSTPLLKEVWVKAMAHFDEEDPDELGDFMGLRYEDVREEITLMFDDIDECSRRIKNIVLDLKDYAKPNHELPFREESLFSVTQVSSSLLKNTIKTATDDFVLTPPEDEIMIYCNRQQIEQVLINLIQNACHAMEDSKGSISVTCKKSPDQKSALVIEEDEGCGIEEESLTRLTDPFFTTKRDGGGMGLGLAITSRIIKNHRGSLHFDSTIGKGTRAIVTLPTTMNP